MSRQAALAAALTASRRQGTRFVVIRVGRDFLPLKGGNKLGQEGRWKDGQKYEVVSVIS
jgi:hypothetical protein